MIRNAALVVALLWAGTGFGQASLPAEEKADKVENAEKVTVALLELEGNQAGLEQAPAVAALLASQLSEAPQLKLITQRDIGTLLGIERQRQILKGENCSEDCMVELSGAVGARYVITGRLDRFGPQYVVTMTLFDSAKTTSLAKPHAEAGSDGELPAAVQKLTGDILQTLGAGSKLAPPPVAAPAEPPGAHQAVSLVVKGGSSFFTSIAALSPRADLEIGWVFHPEWIAFVQVGVTFVRAGELGSINVVPSVIGTRHLYLVTERFHPYWGLGLGVQLSFNEFGIFTKTGPLPTIIGLAGLQYMLFEHVGLMLEGGTNVAQTLLGLVASGQQTGLALELRAGVAFRF